MIREKVLEFLEYPEIVIGFEYDMFRKRVKKNLSLVNHMT